MPGALTDFTPFGYLRNPGHRATSWSDTSGGNLRTSPDLVGVEWVYPVGRDAASRVGLALETVVEGRPCRTRAEFDAIGLTSRYHSCLIFGFDWQVDGVQVEARFFLVDDDTLCGQVVATNVVNDVRTLTISLLGVSGARTIAGAGLTLTETPCPHVLICAEGRELCLAAGESSRFVAALARGPDALLHGNAALPKAEGVLKSLLVEDAEFYAHCPSLSGDWPAHWAQGLHHDFETTRLLVQPPRGIFRDVWPTWMAAWPRVVLAEGTLDMLRLAYADPGVAKRAVLSLFRDAPQPNVPCVFEGGEYNMVAADGSRCGTSPAWCLPFLNLELLYLRTLDREWLEQVFPYAAAYLEWWLEHRVDGDGWLVYKCTWESGEDGNPRLDPSGSGDADISGHVRPVELQATMAHAADVMAFFAHELGVDASRWREIESDFRARTRILFDSAAGRYRDKLLGPCPDRPYWGIDACRYSAQSLTPLLIGEPLPQDEVVRHVCPPWTLWPSWTWSLIESAAAGEFFSVVGQLAFDTVDRVYRITTRRELGSLARPMPGTSPEFWPEDWRTYAGSDAYGWGATTANLLIRHLFGFQESRATDGWVVELAPTLPAELLHVGARYGIRRLNYRDLVFDLWYVVESDHLRVELDLGGESRTCLVTRAEQIVFSSIESNSKHHFEVHVGRPVILTLR
jgi:hypothetical protein